MNCYFLKSEFWNFTPNWFDLTTVCVSIFSVFGGYWIATKIYSKERKDKAIEERDLIASEIKLFKNSLSQLNVSVDDQIKNLNHYLEEKKFELKINQGVHIDFLHFINIKYLYKSIGVEKKDEINEINMLLASLYALNEFRTSLRDELRSYLNKYEFHENKFYLYRKLLYTKYFELCNLRSGDFIIDNGIKKWKFNDGDLFMKKYTELRMAIFKDNEVIDGNGIKDRGELIKKFVIPLIHIATDYVPEDYNAIEVSDIANEINAAYKDMENITESHFKAITSYVDILGNISYKTVKYLK